MQYKFRNFGIKKKILVDQIQRINAARHRAETCEGILPDGVNRDISISKALLRMQKKHDKFYGNTSKYTPHQGVKERLRRRTSNPYLFGNHLHA